MTTARYVQLWEKNRHLVKTTLDTPDN